MMIPFDANEQIKAALDQIASENIYTDIHFLGEGGTSQVFGCKKGKEDLVLKLVHPKFPFFEPYSPIALEVIFKQDITYFEQEINFNHTLYHPGFFGMYDYGIVNYTFPIKSEVPYLVFPRYYETFEDVILSDKSFGTKLRQLIRLCDPLIYLHENGFAYRDLKPDNVPMVKGLSFLSDFGCVYNLSDHAPIIGTEGYAPPEQYQTWEHDSISHPSNDVWTMAVMLYQVALKIPSIEVRGGIYYHFLPFAKDEPSPYTEIRVSPQYFKKASSHFGFSSGQIDMMSGIFSGTFIEDYTQRISMPEMKLRLIDLLAVC